MIFLVIVGVMAIRPRWLLAGYGVAAVATLAMTLVGGTGHPWPALAFIALATAVASVSMSVPEAAFCAAMGWLFFDGFILGRHAHLAWQPTTGWAALVCLAAGLAGAMAATARRGIKHRAAGHPRQPRAGEIGPLRDGDNVVSLAGVRRHREVRRTAS